MRKDKNRQIYLCSCVQTHADVRYIEDVRDRVARSLGTKVFCPHADVGIASDSRGLSPTEVFRRDIQLLYNSKAVLFLYTRCSFGSLIELGVAYECEIPIIALNCTTHCTTITHPILQGVIYKEVFSIEDAIQALREVIDGYQDGSKDSCY